MHAVVLSKTGPAGNLIQRELPTPAVTPNHVVVKVQACGVGHRDIIERRGGHPLIQTPIVPGHEFAGEVVEVGAGVKRWQTGDRVVSLYADSCGVCDQCLGGDERRCAHVREVFGLTVDGGYADYVLAAERALEALPSGIDYDVGATLMSAVGVGFHNTAHTAGVTIGDRVLVTGASGGVGAAAIQTAKLLHAEVCAVTGREHKREALTALGADHVIVDGGSGFHKQLAAPSANGGMDVAIDCVGSPTLNSSLRCLRPYGRVVAIGNIDPQPLRLNPGLLAVKAIQLLGSDNVTRGALRQTMALVQTKRLIPRIHERLSLSHAVRAHERIEARSAVGRVVLQPRGAGD